MTRGRIFNFGTPGAIRRSKLFTNSIFGGGDRHGHSAERITVVLNANFDSVLETAVQRRLHYYDEELVNPYSANTAEWWLFDAIKNIMETRAIGFDIGFSSYERDVDELGNEIIQLYPDGWGEDGFEPDESIWEQETWEE